MSRQVVGFILTLCILPAVFAQEKAASLRIVVSVPFIGCNSDGQVGPKEAPKGASKSVSTTSKAAQGLAYYQAALGFGVLAPRGWHCVGTYGSGGDALFVSPEPIDTANGHSFAGPAIAVSYRFGGTSGRYQVAEIMARVFPTYNRAFVIGVMTGLDQPTTYAPYPRDALTYKSKTVAEYTTPAQTDGLGTYGVLRKNDSPIAGVAILVGQTPDLLLLSVRLPRELLGLTAAIVRQAERDGARPPRE